MNRSEMILSAFFFNPQGNHRMSWRHPMAPNKEIFGLDYYQHLAKVSEDAKFDAFFVADHVAMWDTYESNVVHYANARLEPITLLSALSTVTKNIGLVGTVSASYSEPYNVARTFASLDHLSNGRASWNVVTSGMNEEAMNFGRDANIEHGFRYERAAEFLDTAKALWDSWEDEAVLIDKQSGRFADMSRVHRINHEGRHFKVRGPLNVPRPIQGYPVIVQAGSSNDGKDLAAKHADLHFAMFRNIEDGLRYRRDFNERLAKNGRSPDSLKILPGIVPIVGRSAAEAKEKQEFLETLVPERVGVDLVSSWCGLDLSGLSIDGQLPDLPDEATYDGQRSNLLRIRALADQKLTIREIARQITTGGSAPTMAGTPTDIADEMEAWFKGGATDGFNLMFPVMPGDWVEFASLVVPELQRRGVVQKEYRSGSFREKLGLTNPSNSLIGNPNV